MVECELGGIVACSLDDMLNFALCGVVRVGTDELELVVVAAML